MKAKSDTRLGAVIGLALALAPGAWASGPVAAASPDSVRVPFVPTLGKPLHLHLVVNERSSRNKVDQPVQETTSDEDLVFTERNSAGYVLRWTTMKVRVQAAPDRQAIMEQIMGAEIGKPILIQTDSNGAPVSVINASEVRALLAASFATLDASIDGQSATRPQEEREAMHKMFSALSDSYRKMSDAQLSATVLQQPSTVLGFGDVTLTRGHAVTFSRPLAVPMANAKVTGVTRVDLRDSEPGAIVIAVSTVPDPAELTAVAGALVQKMLASVAADQRADLKAVLNKLPPMTMTDEVVLTLDAGTGLPRHAEHRTTEDMGLASKTRTEDYAFSD